MKITQSFLSCMCVIIAFTFASANDYREPRIAAPDEFFDSYGNISWDDEKARLDNFAIELQHDPNLIGYIVVYAGRHACYGEAPDRALRAKEYIEKIHSFRENQIKWIDGGYREELTVILQPLPRDAPEPVISPTLKPSEVVIKNCKLKKTKRKSYSLHPRTRTRLSSKRST